MACKTTTRGTLFVVRWRAFTIEACERVVGDIASMHAKSGARVPYLGIMPADMPNVDAGGRKALELLMNGIMQHCEVAAVAVESRGFTGALYRSLLTGLMLVSQRGERLKFVDSVDAAVKTLQGLPLPSATEIESAIIEVGGAWQRA